MTLHLEWSCAEKAADLVSAFHRLIKIQTKMI